MAKLKGLLISRPFNCMFIDRKDSISNDQFFLMAHFHISFQVIFLPYINIPVL